MNEEKRHTYEACHQVGYKMEFDAPESISNELLTEVFEEFKDWTDEPDQDALKQMLVSRFTEHELLQDLLKIDFYAESVHREAFIQSESWL